MKIRWTWIVLPTLVGSAAGLTIYFSSLPDPQIFVQINLSLLLFGFSLLISLGLVLLKYQQQRDHELVKFAEDKYAEDRRRFYQRLDHELKNPLTAVLAGLANLAQAEEKKQREQTLNNVGAQVNRIRQLSSELRKLADLETRPLDFREVDLTLLLEESYQLIQDMPDANLREITLTVPHAPWPLPPVSGDIDLLSLAIHNLLVNAIKFTQQSDTVELRAFEDGTHVVIEVADTGPGIPGEEIAYIWEELYRGAAARGTPGSGLGLALVRAIINRHQGQISLRSREGEGSVFTIRLPAVRR